MENVKETTVSNFVQQDKEAWIKLAETGLKGKPFDSIQCEVEPGLLLDPLYMKSEVQSFAPINWSTEAWKIVEWVTMSLEQSLEDFNETILTALSGGCEILQLSVPEEANFNPEIALKNVRLEMIKIRALLSSTHREALLNYVNEYAKTLVIDRTSITIEFWGESILRFAAMDEEDVYSDQLAKITDSLAENIDQNKCAWSNVIIDIPVGNHLFAEISKIRALKLLIYGLADKLKKPLTDFPTLHARIKPIKLLNELETVIERSSMTVAAVLGGVDEISISWSFDTNMKLNNDDKRRLHRNIHWLLREESRLESSCDVLNGSYWVEKCTQEFVERAWAKTKVGGES